MCASVCYNMAGHNSSCCNISRIYIFKALEAQIPHLFYKSQGQIPFSQFHKFNPVTQIIERKKI